MNDCRLFGLFVIASCLSACSAGDSRVADLQKSLTESESKRTAVEQQLKGLTERVVSLEQANQWHNILAKIEGIAPSELGFVRAKHLGHTGMSLRRG